MMSTQKINKETSILDLMFDLVFFNKSYCNAIQLFHHYKCQYDFQ